MKGIHKNLRDYGVFTHEVLFYFYIAFNERIAQLVERFLIEVKKRLRVQIPFLFHVL